MSILDRHVRKLRSKEIPIIKVLWRNHSQKEVMWEVEEEMRFSYPYLFKS